MHFTRGWRLSTPRCQLCYNHTKLQTFGFAQFSPRVLSLFRDPTEDATSHLAVMSPWAPLPAVCDRFSDQLPLSWLWHWGVLVRYFVESLKMGLSSVCSLLNWGYGFGEECYTSDVSFSSHPIRRRMPSTQLIMGDFDLITSSLGSPHLFLAMLCLVGRVATSRAHFSYTTWRAERQRWCGQVLPP